MTAPRLSRRHAAGAESARGLLFTVLGEFVLRTGGSAWTSTVIDVLGRFGVEEKASRQALMRTAADGWLKSERVGRRSCWSLTPQAEALLVDGTERIFGFTGTQPDWDGRWLLVLARAPETDRPARHVLRTRLSWAGLGTPAPGVWISTHADRIEEIEQVLADAGLRDESHVFVAAHGTGGNLRDLVRQAWDLDGIEQSYQAFVAAFGADFGSRPASDPLTCLIELVHAWRRFPWIDPLLPRELLPTPWSGVDAAALFARTHDALAPAATEQWRALDGE